MGKRVKQERELPLNKVLERIKTNNDSKELTLAEICAKVEIMCGVKYCERITTKEVMDGWEELNRYSQL